MNRADDTSESACVTSCIVKICLGFERCIALRYIDFFYFGLSVLVSFLPCDRLGHICWRSLMSFSIFFITGGWGFRLPVCACFGQQRVVNERLIPKQVWLSGWAQSVGEELHFGWQGGLWQEKKKTRKPFNANLFCFMIKTFEFKAWQWCKWLLVLFSIH